MDPRDPFQPTPRREEIPEVKDPFGTDLSHSNPYASASDPQPLTTSGNPGTPPEFAPRQSDRPRWWTTLAVCGVSLATFLLITFVMILVAFLVVHGKITLELLRDPNSMADVSKSRTGLLLLVVVPQLALVVPALVAAFLSPVETRRRLSLVRGHWPVWAWIAAAVTTPLIGMASGIVLGIFMEESEALKEMTQIFRDHGQNGFLIPLALMIGATPAFCEELLFRGYVQTRLTRSFHPVLGIFIASFLFASFHMDPVHVIAVFPLGLFLGWITWQSGSLFPAMMGHFVNNVISVVAVVLAPEADPDVLALPAIGFTIAILAAGILGMAAVSFASVVYGKPEPDAVITTQIA